MSENSTDKIMATLLSLVKEAPKYKPMEYCEGALNMAIFEKDRVSTNDDSIYLRENIQKNTIDTKCIEIAKEIYRGMLDLVVSDFAEDQKEFEGEITKEILKYKRKIIITDATYQLLEFILVVGSALLPFIIYFSNFSKIIFVFYSAIIALAATITKYYKFGEHVANLKTTFEKMQNEINLFQTNRGQYGQLNNGASLELFMDKIDEIRHQHNKLTLSFRREMQNQNKELIDLIQDKLNKMDVNTSS